MANVKVGDTVEIIKVDEFELICGKPRYKIGDRFCVIAVPSGIKRVGIRVHVPGLGYGVTLLPWEYKVVDQ